MQLHATVNVFENLGHPEAVFINQKRNFPALDVLSSNLLVPTFSGVTCVLNGMRRRNYVDDSLDALGSPPFDVALHLYEAFNQM